MNTKDENIKSLRASVRELQKEMNYYIIADNLQRKAADCKDYNLCEEGKAASLKEMRRILTAMVGKVGLMMSCSDVIPIYNSLFVTQENIDEHYGRK